MFSTPFHFRGNKESNHSFSLSYFQETFLHLHGWEQKEKKNMRDGVERERVHMNGPRRSLARPAAGPFKSYQRKYA